MIIHDWLQAAVGQPEIPSVVNCCYQLLPAATDSVPCLNESWPAQADGRERRWQLCCEAREWLEIRSSVVEYLASYQDLSEIPEMFQSVWISIYGSLYMVISIWDLYAYLYIDGISIWLSLYGISIYLSLDRYLYVMWFINATWLDCGRSGSWWLVGISSHLPAAISLAPLVDWQMISNDGQRRLITVTAVVNDGQHWLLVVKIRTHIN